ncbi:hypothetical protein [Agarilytica rhodophyticola]|uniref:hypothetical protein n=1 Tax=Agarilytica rhodophyticola TaxID=1737490 RepID=UPI000B341515|nr:hypothetical protein [Agarilytica rhodophyticola]
MKNIKSNLLILVSLVLFGCEKAEQSDDSNTLDDSLVMEQPKDTFEDPYREYCYFGANQDDECSAEGKGIAIGSISGDGMNHTVRMTISHKDLDAIGLSYIGVSYNVLNEVPRFHKGKFSVQATADFPNPKRITKTSVFLVSDDIDRNKPKTFIMEVDKPLVTGNNLIQVDDYPDFSIKSAVLTITNAQNIEADQQSVTAAAIAGGVTGRQYIQGSLSLSLEKFGPQGRSLISTYHFATTSEWTHIANAN